MKHVLDLSNILIVGLGGFLGSISRYVVVFFVDRKINSNFPYGTLTVNLVGSFILGVVVASIYKEQNLSAQQWKLFLTTGFCGGFTTFSAFAFENVNLISQKMQMTSIAYTLLSIALGCMAVGAGIALGRAIN